MLILIEADFKVPEERERFITIMEHGGFKVSHRGSTVTCEFNGYVPDCLLRQLPMAVKQEYQARNNEVYRRCLEVSNVL